MKKSIQYEQIFRNDNMLLAIEYIISSTYITYYSYNNYSKTFTLWQYVIKEVNYIDNHNKLSIKSLYHLYNK